MGNSITKQEISKEDYEKLVEMKKTSIKDFFQAIEDLAWLSPFPPNAYGCQLPKEVYEKDGKYFASWSCWDSCD